MSWKTLPLLVLGRIKSETLDAMANPIKNPFKRRGMNSRAEEISVNVPARVMVIEAKIENATIGSWSSIGFSARREFAALDIVYSAYDAALSHHIIKTSQMAATAQASLLYTLRTLSLASGGMLSRLDSANHQTAPRRRYTRREQIKKHDLHEFRPRHQSLRNH